jgi:hypothetical protein
MVREAQKIQLNISYVAYTDIVLVLWHDDAMCTLTPISTKSCSASYYDTPPPPSRTMLLQATLTSTFNAIVAPHVESNGCEFCMAE